MDVLYRMLSVSERFALCYETGAGDRGLLSSASLSIS